MALIYILVGLVLFAVSVSLQVGAPWPAAIVAAVLIAVGVFGIDVDTS